MKTKKENTELESLRAEVAQLRASREQAVKDWIEERQKSGAAIHAQMELGKLQKQMRIIGHISAGRGHEAILEILEPLPYLFNLDIRFGDDKTRLAASTEMLDSLKKQLAEHLAGFTIQKDSE